MAPRAEDPDDDVAAVEIDRWQEIAARPDVDRVASEEPLEIQVGAEPLAVVMRTPGHDRELALGFLITEAVISGPDDLAALRHESVSPDPASAGNVIRALLRTGAAVDVARVRRNLYVGSSCGVCGKTSLERALATAPPLEDASRFAGERLLALPERLRESQRAFAATGGIHAAAIFDGDGKLLVVREDVGRHTAVDKTIGWAAANGRLPLAGHGLLVSGRISFEIVQKALAARLPVVAAVSAPTSLAVDLATAGGVALVGFLRGRGFNVYGARERIE
ncbi:MAG TPA: formate dehydrogenase accessory sulfurtransferase FdhD [Myxococcota bacterium]|nr:formate dehydrogenase accessory sulfurtransferase FdhD [Myxococcota bacterium]